MKGIIKNLLPVLAAVLIIALSIGGPELFARYKDRAILGKVHEMAAEAEGQGYRYTLSQGEKLYILAESLSGQTVPANEQYVLSGGGRPESYEGLEGNYAFVVNHKGPSEKEITDDQVYNTCNRELEALKGAGILPDAIRPVEPEAYRAVLYSAIDVLEPRNNVAVWKIELWDIQKNVNKENRLINAYIDADDGRLYEFYVRTPLRWEDVDPDAIMQGWSAYMGLDMPGPYGEDNPLAETTPYFKKYIYPGPGGEAAVVTVGFYEGINELFLKISR